MGCCHGSTSLRAARPRARPCTPGVVAHGEQAQALGAVLECIHEVLVANDLHACASMPLGWGKPGGVHAPVWHLPGTARPHCPCWAIGDGAPTRLTLNVLRPVSTSFAKPDTRPSVKDLPCKAVAVVQSTRIGRCTPRHRAAEQAALKAGGALTQRPPRRLHALQLLAGDGAHQGVHVIPPEWPARGRARPACRRRRRRRGEAGRPGLPHLAHC